MSFLRAFSGAYFEGRDVSMNGTFRPANTDERDGTRPHIYETLFPGYIVCHVLYVRDPRDVLSWLPFCKSDGPCYLDAAED